MDAKRNLISKVAVVAAAVSHSVFRVLRRQKNQDGTWCDVDDMINAMFEHCRRTGAEAIPCDSGGRMGYATFLPGAPPGGDDSRIWHIHMSDLVSSFERLRRRDPKRASMLGAMLSTAEGRRAVAHAATMFGLEAASAVP